MDVNAGPEGGQRGSVVGWYEAVPASEDTTGATSASEAA